MTASPQAARWGGRPRALFLPRSRVPSGGAAPALPGRAPPAQPAPPPPAAQTSSRYSRSSCPAAASSSRGPSCLGVPDRPLQGLPAAPLTSSRSPLAAEAALSSGPLTAAQRPAVRPAGSMSAPTGLGAGRDSDPGCGEEAGGGPGGSAGGGRRVAGESLGSLPRLGRPGRPAFRCGGRAATGWFYLK